MSARAISLLLASLAMTLHPVHARAQSQYLALPADVTVTTKTTLLHASLSLSKAAKVLVVSDGRFYQTATNSAAYLHIDIGGTPAGNNAIIDWRGSSAPAQHSYEIVGFRSLSAGTYNIDLVGDFIAGSYAVAADSNLIVFVNPATQIKAMSLPVDVGRCSTITGNTSTSCSSDANCAGAKCEFNFITGDLSGGMQTWGPQLNMDPRNEITLLTTTFNPAGQDIVALAAGRAYRTSLNGNGDAMMNIYMDGAYGSSGSTYAGQNTSQWSVNDMNEIAELQAPLYSQGYFKAPSTGRNHTVSLTATEFVYGSPNENAVRYRYGASTSLVVLSGGMSIKGGTRSTQMPGCAGDYIPIGPSKWCSGRARNTDYVIATQKISVTQANHPVLFSAKAREQSGELQCGTEAGNIYLWLTIDSGSRVGPLGVQQLKAGSTQSQRTISTSYLATNLPLGTRTIKVHAESDGTLCDANILDEMVLLYFD